MILINKEPRVPRVPNCPSALRVPEYLKSERIPRCPSSARVPLVFDVIGVPYECRLKPPLSTQTLFECYLSKKGVQHHWDWIYKVF